jgi:hypothetical protein
MTAYPSQRYSVEVWRGGARQSSLSSAATAALVSASVDHAMIGGCLSGSFVFAREWSDGALAQQGDEIRFLVDGRSHFRGFVEPINRSIAAVGQQSIDALGWWHRLSRIQPLGATPTVDRVEFGVSGEDEPDLETAAEILAHLLTEYVIADDVSPITAGAIASPTNSTKVGRWTLYQDTSLAAAVEQLSTMDDCFCGVDVDAKFYVASRKTLDATAFATIQIGDLPSSPAEFLSMLVLNDGVLRIEGDPVIGVSVGGRDVAKTRGRRKYLAADVPASGGRTVNYYRPEIQTGQAARRYAAGKLRQFGSTVTVVENAKIVTGSTTPLQCTRGAITIKDTEGTTIDSALPARITVEYHEDIQASVTLGLLQSDPGGGDVANDAFAPDVGLLDDPAIDVGESWEIDFGDGEPGPFGDTDGGDGDDLHSNDSRSLPTDAAGSGSGSGTNGAIDYGTDEASSSNGAGRSYLLTPRSAIIKAKPSTGVYHVRLTDAQGNEVGAQIEFCETFPTPNDDSLSVDDLVLVFYRDEALATKPSIISGVGGSGGDEDVVFAFTGGGAFFMA